MADTMLEARSKKTIPLQGHHEVWCKDTLFSAKNKFLFLMSIEEETIFLIHA